jgi:hypothetical protein
MRRDLADLSDRGLVFFFAVDIEGRNVSSAEIANDRSQQQERKVQ